jgi:hypothetical protein
MSSALVATTGITDGIVRLISNPNGNMCGKSNTYNEIGIKNMKKY